MRVLARKVPFSPVLLVFLPFAAGYHLSYLFRTINAIIAPDLIAELNLHAGFLGLMTSVYFLSFAAVQLPLGVLLDRFGPRRVQAPLMIVAAAGALHLRDRRAPLDPADGTRPDRRRGRRRADVRPQSTRRAVPEGAAVAAQWLVHHAGHNRRRNGNGAVCGAARHCRLARTVLRSRGGERRGRRRRVLCRRGARTGLRASRGPRNPRTWLAGNIPGLALSRGSLRFRPRASVRRGPFKACGRRAGLPTSSA